ncbi:MAG: two-component regulator propeller domain-containing protein, partial [Balneolaceae bacterium]|nr:two-component regulator propeller domain-containing protein [Balneolaceae bacterium]
MSLRIALLAAALLFVVSEAEGQLLPFTHYTPEREINALPSAEVHKVYQDRLGYIWFAIYSSGLVRYDGVNMINYGTGSGLRDVTVWDMIEDPTGRLWVSSNAGLMVSKYPLTEYEVGERITFIAESNDIHIIDVTVSHNKMTVSESGWLWVGTESLGVIRYRFTGEDKLEADTLSLGNFGEKGGTTVRSLVARKDGSVWVSLLDGHIVQYNSDGNTQFHETGSGINTNALFESDDGRLWGGEQEGRIWRLQESGDEYAFLEVSNRLNSNISNISSDEAGNIWVSSEGTGLLKIDPNLAEQPINYRRNNGLLSEIV